MTIREGAWLEVGGRRHWVAVRGEDRGNPALLFVAGAGAAFSAAAPYFAPWEPDFTVIHWDQPGAGFTGGSPAGYAELGELCAGVAGAAAARFGLPKPAVLATSGGTITALLAAKARPDAFSAYVGTGQIVNRARQEALSYAMVLDRARAAGDAAAVAELEGVGPPPYADVTGDLVKSKYANAPTASEAAEWAQLVALAPPKAGDTHVPAGAAVGDPRAAAFAGYLATRDALAAFDARAVGRLAMPMHVIQGEDDAHTVTSEVVEWAGEVGASLSLIPGAGHLSVFLRQPMLARLKAVLG